MRRPQSAMLLLLYCLPYLCYAQDQPDKATGIIDFPSRFFSRIQSKTASLDDQLTRQTEKYLQKMARREARLQKKLYKVDSNAAKSLFAGSADQYAALSQKLANDTGAGNLSLNGEYQAYTDSLQGMLKFLQSGPNGIPTSPKLQSSLRQLQALQSKMQDADQIKEYIRQRKQQISQYIQQHTNLSGLLGKDFKAMNQDVYYYSQQVREYREMLNDPDKMTKQALVILNKLPAFQAFMKQNSQLTGLFNLPANYGSTATLAGLQTRDQVAALIQQQVSAAGAGGQAALHCSALRGDFHIADARMDYLHSLQSRITGHLQYYSIGLVIDQELIDALEKGYESCDHTCGTGWTRD